MNGIEKRSIWHLEFRKTDPISQFGEGFKLRKNVHFRNAGRLATGIAPRLWIIWPKFKHHHPRTALGVAEKKLAPNDPVAPRYGRLGETDLDEKSYFSDRGRYGIGRCAKTTLSYAAAP